MVIFRVGVPGVSRKAFPVKRALFQLELITGKSLEFRRPDLLRRRGLSQSTDSLEDGWDEISLSAFLK